MIVRNLAQLAGTERDVRGEGWRSRRFLRRDDAVKFSLHLTEIEAGTRLELAYANHFEANYCIASNGEAAVVSSGKIHHPAPATMSALDQHERHIRHAKSPLNMHCVC